MAIVELPVHSVYDQQEPLDVSVIQTYQQQQFRIGQFAEVSRLVLAKAAIVGGEIDLSFYATVYSGEGLAFLYRNPWSTPQPLPYEVGSHNVQIPPEPRQLPHGFGLTLDLLKVDISPDSTILEARGELDDGTVTISFDDIDDMFRLVEHTRDQSSPAV